MNIIITGGHSGMGLELTKKLLHEGHKIGLIIRSEKRRDAAIEAVGLSKNLDFFIADLSIRKAVKDVAAEIVSKWDSIDGLFNNAGLLLDKAYYSEHGNEMQFEVNAVSPYLLAMELQPILNKSENAFVVNTATGGLNNKKSLDISDLKKPKKFVKLTGSYMQSKFALVLLMNYFAKKWPNIRIVSVNPGPIKTKMTSGDGMPIWLLPIRNLLFLSPARGAQSLYNAAFSDKYAGKSAIFISEKKIRPLKYEANQAQVNEMLD